MHYPNRGCALGRRAAEVRGGGGTHRREPILQLVLVGPIALIPPLQLDLRHHLPVPALPSETA